MPIPKNNLAALKGGPAMIYINGVALYTKTGIQFDPQAKWENILVDGFDVIDLAKSSIELPMKFTPAGQYTAAHVGALCGQIALPLGRWITPVLPISEINTGTGQLTVPNHGQTTGQAVYFGTDNTLPTITGGALSTGTLYYLGVVDANTVELYTSAANAESSTSPISFTNTGTGNMSFVINYVVTIQSINLPISITFKNCAVSGPLTFQFTADGKTIFGDITLSAFLSHNAAPGDEDAYYVIGNGSFDPSTFPSAASILTQPYTAAWGDVVPWAAIQSKDGFKFTYTPKLEDVMVDGLGVVTKQLTGATAIAGFTPVDAGDSDLFPLANIDTAMGSRLQAVSNDFIVQGTNVYARLYCAGFSKVPILYNMKDRRAGAVELMATRQFPGGAAQPLLYVGTAAP